MSRTSEGVSSNAEDSMGMFMQSRKAEIDGVQVKKRTRRLLDESDEDWLDSPPIYFLIVLCILVRGGTSKKRTK